jgi:hypothetical protein
MLIPVKRPSMDIPHIVDVRLVVVPRQGEEEAIGAEHGAVHFAIKTRVPNRKWLKVNGGRCFSIAAGDVIQAEYRPTSCPSGGQSEVAPYQIRV